MKLLSVKPCEPSEMIEFDGLEWRHYKRNVNGVWSCRMNGTLAEIGEWPEAEALYQAHKSEER